MLFTSDLVSTPLVLAALYLGLLMHVGGALRVLQGQTLPASLSLRKLFLVSCLVSTVLRVVAFVSLGVINLVSMRPGRPADLDLSSPETLDLLEKSELVLFDLPDFCFVSAYLLLLIKWADAFLFSRKHWFSSQRYRRLFVFSFVVFNALLYSSQVGLYALLFFPSVDQNLLANAIYCTLAAVNFVIPLLWLSAFIVLSIQVHPHSKYNASHSSSSRGSRTPPSRPLDGTSR